MFSGRSIPIQFSYGVLARGISVVLMAVSLIVLGGWALQVKAITQIVPGFATMKPNTALSFGLAGVALFLIAPERATSRRLYAGRACALLVAGLGLVTLSQYITGYDLGIDRVLFPDAVRVEAVTYPGRMSPATAFNFIVLGLALYFSLSPSLYVLSQICALITVIVAILALVGYVYEIDSLYDFAPYETLALHTAISFFLGGVGVIVARPQCGVMALITHDGPGGQIARRLLPVAILVPFFFGLFGLAGERAGWYDGAFGLALIALANMLVFSAFVGLNAWFAYTLDRERLRAGHAHQQSELRYRHTLDTMLEGCQIIGFDWQYLYLNDSAAQYGRQSKDDLLGSTVMERYPGFEDTPLFALLDTCMREREPQLAELEFTYPDGDTAWFEFRVRPVPEGIFILSLDITERKATAAAIQESQARLAGIVESAMDAIISIDEDQRIVVFNRTAEEMFRCSEAEVIGQPLARFIPARFHQQHEAHIRRFGSTGVTARRMGQLRDVMGVRATGEEFPIEASISQIELDGRKNFTVILRDITERKNAERTIRKSEERFRTAVETMPNAVVAVNQDGRIELVNPSVAEIFGYKQEELIGEALDILLPERFRTQHKVFRAEYFDTPSPRPMGVGRDLAGRRKDGSEFPVEVGLSFTRTQAGPLALAFITDITARKQAQERLTHLLEREQKLRSDAETARQRFSFLAEASILMASSLDYRRTLDQITALAVPRIADWCAIDLLQEGTLTRMAATHVDSEALDKVRTIFQRYPADPDSEFGLYHVLRTGQPELYAEFPDSLLETFVRSDEHRQLLHDLQMKSIMIAPLTLRGVTFGTITFVSTQDSRTYTADDLTMASELAQRAAFSIDNTLLYREAKTLNAELEQRVQERTAQLETANQELEAFSYSVSHDLRAPLRALDGFSLALLEDYYDIIDDEGKEFLQLIRTESQRMGQLIDALLALSRFTRTEIRKTQIDLSEMAVAIASELQKEDPQREVDFIIEQDLEGYGDVELIRTVLRNLIANAWKYTAKTPQAIIEFGTQRDAGETEYFVRDNGVGFNMDYVHKLFGPFQRLHSMKEFEGTGIGLATVQRIIHRHGGTVRAEGAVDEGATFYFTLGTGEQTP